MTKNKDDALVFVPMCADFLHNGHINILESAAENGKVIVLLMTDDAMKSYKRPPKIAYAQRERILRAISLVSDVIPCQGPDTYALMARTYKPDYFYHGDDWKTGCQAQGRLAVVEEMKKHSGEVIEPKYTENISSTGLHKMFVSTIQESSNTGVVVRGALNDLKRTPSMVEKETGVNEEVVTSLIKGQTLDRGDSDIMLRILQDTYPISKKHLAVDVDNSEDGVWYFSEKQSKDSARVLDRVNGYGDTVHYYRYMDTATSAISPFKPELIEQLVDVADNDPHNPLVVMNKGHLLTQLTFFIGPVNFYCTVRGKRQCKIMNTGDSCFIIPYVPHSFTSRDPNSYTAIVAVTFSGHVRDSFNDLMHHDMQQIMQYAGDSRDQSNVFTQKLHRFCNLRGTTPDVIRAALLEKGHAAETVDLAYLDQDDDVLNEIADMLAVPKQEFVVRQLEENEEVTYASTPFTTTTDTTKDARVDHKFPLATNAHFPDAGGYAWTLSGTATMTSHYFEYIYNYGTVSVTIEWQGHYRTLHPGDSALIKPFMEVTYKSQTVLNCHYPACVVVCKVGGCVNSSVMHECSLFAREGLKTTTKNIAQWW